MDSDTAGLLARIAALLGAQPSHGGGIGRLVRPGAATGILDRSGLGPVCRGQRGLPDGQRVDRGQLEIALFWSDDPGTTATPPGHSASILTQTLRSQNSSLATAAVGYARLGLAVCDAFIECWDSKFRYNLLRPISYIRQYIDQGWGNPLPLTTPPFPEYTSGHSVQSGAAATVLTATFGSIAFTDHTHDARGLPPRSFSSFEAAAQEAAISRLYGGIHYRAAIERGLEQGRRIGAAVVALPLRG